jgi:hypothetical protein
LICDVWCRSTRRFDDNSAVNVTASGVQWKADAPHKQAASSGKRRREVRARERVCVDAMCGGTDCVRA